MHKIKNWLLFLTIFFIGVIQATALGYISLLLGAKPDFLLISVIYFTLYFGKYAGIKAAILGGLFKDITSAAVFGSNAFGFCLCALFLNHYGSHFYEQKISTQIFLCGSLYYTITLIVLFANYGISKSIHIQLSPYFWMLFKGALYTGFISPLLFFILSKVFRVKLIHA